MNLIGAVVLGIALFAHQYEVTCQKCHSVIPRLNDFGLRFMAAGDRIPGVKPGPAVPLATKVNLAYTSADGAGLPKAIVDEIEVFTAGAIGDRASYFVEQYVVDGGQHGLLRDAWINDRVNPWTAKIPVYLQAGSFTLPLPVDPETFRETAAHYAIFDQTIGNNPFNFFTPKVGAKATVGDVLRGASVQLFAAPGYDRVSGVPTRGIDEMIAISEAARPFTLSYYNYQGTRPDAASLLDRFARNGYALVYDRGKWTSETVLQTGFDSSINGAQSSSSGGFTQLRYAFNQRVFALARYEGTNDINGFMRQGIVLLGYRPSRNARITIEDDIANDLRATHTLNMQYTVGY